MKHNATYPTLAALLLTLAFAGCKQEPLPESGDAIRFAVTPAVTSGLQTKADPSVEADLIADGKTIIALLALYAVWSARKIMRLSAVLHILVRMLGEMLEEEPDHGRRPERQRQRQSDCQLSQPPRL